MAVPEGYTKLGRIGYADKGDYDTTMTYYDGDVVYYEGTTYVCASEAGCTAVTPQNDGTNWKYLARGSESDSLDEVIEVTIDAALGTDGTEEFEGCYVYPDIPVSGLLSTHNVVVMKGTRDQIYNAYVVDGGCADMAEATKTYTKEFAKLSSGTAVLSDGSITFYTTKQLEYYVPVGIKILR